MEYNVQDKRKAAQSNPQIHVYHQKSSRAAKKAPAVKPFYWITLAIALGALAASKFIILKPLRNAVPAVAQSAGEKNRPIAGGLIVYADRQGHYRGTLQINGVEAPFMIDTGATLVVVPSRIADAAGLQQGQAVSVSTAGGQVLNYLTTIDSLKLGNAEIFNVQAAINPYNEEILIGLSALKYFTLQQNRQAMTLVTNHQSGGSIIPRDPGNNWAKAAENSPAYASRPASPDAVPAPVEAASKATSSWKKTTHCDAGGHCTTVYH